MGQLVSKLFDFMDILGSLLLDENVLSAVLLKLFEDLFIFGLYLVLWVLFEIIQLLALFLQEILELVYRLNAFLPLLIRRIPFLSQLFNHLLI